MKRAWLLLTLFFLPLPLPAGHFPLCMYGVNNPSDLPLLKKAGFTCVQTYQKEPEKLASLAQAAQRLGMMTIRLMSLALSMKQRPNIGPCWRGIWWTSPT